jgi:DNA-binding NarL/FixJ family response regulator
VLKLVVQGMSNAEIAERLTLELGTVNTHVHNILDKLNVISRHEAAAYLAILENEQLPASDAPA